MSLAQVEELDSTYEDIISGRAIPTPEPEAEEVTEGEEESAEDATVAQSAEETDAKLEGEDKS